MSYLFERPLAVHRERELVFTPTRVEEATANSYETVKNWTGSIMRIVSCIHHDELPLKLYAPPILVQRSDTHDSTQKSSTNC